MPGHHSSHHSSSHHSSSSHHTSSTHHTTHTTPIHHTHTSNVGVPGMMVGRRSSGRGCIQAFVAIFIVVFVIAGVAVYMSVKAASNAVSSLTSSAANMSSSSSDLKTDPTVIADVAIMDKALLARIPGWQAQNDTIVHHVPTSDAGLPSDFNTKEVVYGHCTSSQFYVFVLNVTKPDGMTADTEGYEYVPGSTPQACAPTGWNVMTSEDAAPDWYFVTLNTTAATASPAASGSGATGG